MLNQEKKFYIGLFYLLISGEITKFVESSGCFGLSQELFMIDVDDDTNAEDISLFDAKQKLIEIILTFKYFMYDKDSNSPEGFADIKNFITDTTVNGKRYVINYNKLNYARGALILIEKTMKLAKHYFELFTKCDENMELDDTFNDLFIQRFQENFIKEEVTPCFALSRTRNVKVVVKYAELEKLVDEAFEALKKCIAPRFHAKTKEIKDWLNDILASRPTDEAEEKNKNENQSNGPTKEIESGNKLPEGKSVKFSDRPVDHESSSSENEHEFDHHAKTIEDKREVHHDSKTIEAESVGDHLKNTADSESELVVDHGTETTKSENNQKMKRGCKKRNTVS